MRTHRVFAIAECTALGRVVPSAPRLAVTATVVLLATLVVAVVVWSALTEADLVVRAPARVRARSAPQLAFSASSGERVSAAAGGRVATVGVHEGQRVSAGEVLATIDTSQLENDRLRLAAARDAARNAREAASRMSELATAQFNAAQAARHAELGQALRDESRGRQRRTADIKLAQGTVAALAREAERLRALERDGAASRSQVEQADAKLGEARVQLEAATVAAAGGRAAVLQRQLELAERDFAVRREELAQQLSQQTSELAAAERRLGNLELEIAKGQVKAETAGVIGTVSVTPGDVVQPGHAMFVISPESGLRVDAAVQVADVARLRVGMPVRIRLDAFDWQRYGVATGTIRQISPDAEPISAGGGQALVYTIRIDLDAERVGTDELRGDLKLGMTGMVEVITGHEHLLPLLLGRMHQAFSLGG